jgi:hypothetical protein
VERRWRAAGRRRRPRFVEREDFFRIVTFEKKYTQQSTTYIDHSPTGREGMQWASQLRRGWREGKIAVSSSLDRDRRLPVTSSRVDARAWGQGYVGDGGGRDEVSGGIGGGWDDRELMRCGSESGSRERLVMLRREPIALFFCRRWKWFRFLVVVLPYYLLRYYHLICVENIKAKKVLSHHHLACTSSLSLSRERERERDSERSLSCSTENT